MKVSITINFDPEESGPPNVEIVHQPDPQPLNPEDNANIAEPVIGPPVPAEAPIRRPRAAAPDRRPRAGAPDRRPRAEAPARRPGRARPNPMEEPPEPRGRLRAGIVQGNAAQRVGYPELLRPPVFVLPMDNARRDEDPIPPIPNAGVLNVAENLVNEGAPPVHENAEPQLPLPLHAVRRAAVPDVLEVDAPVGGTPLCIFCVAHEANMLILPCAHYSACEACLLQTNQLQCPVCRSRTQSTIKIYNGGFIN